MLFRNNNKDVDSVWNILNPAGKSPAVKPGVRKAGCTYKSAQRSNRPPGRATQTLRPQPSLPLLFPVPFKLSICSSPFQPPKTPVPPLPSQGFRVVLVSMTLPALFFLSHWFTAFTYTKLALRQANSSPAFLSTPFLSRISVLMDHQATESI